MVEQLAAFGLKLADANGITVRNGNDGHVKTFQAELVTHAALRFPGLEGVGRNAKAYLGRAIPALPYQWWPSGLADIADCIGQGSAVRSYEHFTHPENGFQLKDFTGSPAEEAVEFYRRQSLRDVVGGASEMGTVPPELRGGW